MKFLAALSYAADGVKVSCTAVAGQNIASSGGRNFKHNEYVPGIFSGRLLRVVWIGWNLINEMKSTIRP